MPKSSRLDFILTLELVENTGCLCRPSVHYVTDIRFRRDAFGRSQGIAHGAALVIVRGCARCCDTRTNARWFICGLVWPDPAGCVSDSYCSNHHRGWSLTPTPSLDVARRTHIHLQFTIQKRECTTNIKVEARHQYRGLQVTSWWGPISPHHPSSQDERTKLTT